MDVQQLREFFSKFKVCLQQQLILNVLTISKRSDRKH